jgi:hypothetical protein
MKKNRARPLRDAWLIWFILGVVMLNYPFLHIFNKDMLILGIPLTILYFFIGWPLSIGVVYLFSVYLGRGRDVKSGIDYQDDAQPPQEQP